MIQSNEVSYGSLYHMLNIYQIKMSETALQSYMCQDNNIMMVIYMFFELINSLQSRNHTTNCL